MTLKCPNCGYENESGTQSCKMCQFAFFKEPLQAPGSAANQSSCGAGHIVASSEGAGLYESIYKFRFLILFSMLVVLYLFFVIIG